MRGLHESIWLAWMRAMALYFRYEVAEGLQHLDGRAVLIAGYHGRPVAWDLMMLTAVLHDRLGYIPRGIVHRGLLDLWPIGWLLKGIGGVPGDCADLAYSVRRGEHVIVTPGGGREGTRSFRDRYRVDWGGRTGYVRLAIKYRMPIVPVAASGVDDTFVGLNDGHALGRRLSMPGDLPLWFGVGAAGLAPFSPPFPVKIRQYIGEPITDTLDGDEDAAAAIHGKVAKAVQGLLDEAVGR